MKMSTIILIGMITIAIPELLMDIFGKGNNLANFLSYIYWARRNNFNYRNYSWYIK